MEDPLYREIILEHWQNPQNYGVVKAATFAADGNNPLCGDQIHITGKIVDGKLVDIAFTAQGCAISKASASLFTDYVKGKTLEQIKRISTADALSRLGIDITPARTKCALLAYSTLNKSLPR